MRVKFQEPGGRGRRSVVPGSITHQILAVASVTPQHWFELEELANRRAMPLCDKSSTAPWSSTALHSQWVTPPTTTCISSRCHREPRRGSR